ncbi:MAG: hypothetical protein IAI48_16180, partial [Candidatus Eremiobacteraeota bacterium]|nr:hypothetical protein [Candidatus Eremiobacteraeota bacterium]
VKDFKLPRDSGNDTLAYALESPAPGPRASPAPGASPKPDDLHATEPGTTLVVRDLAAASDTRIAGVTAYAVSHTGGFVAYALATKDTTPGGVRVLSAAGGATVDALRAKGHFEQLTFAPRRDLLAFVSDAATFASAAPVYALYQSDLGGDAIAATARVLVDRTTPQFADAPPNSNGALRYTKDGSRVFFGTAAVPTPVPSGTPDPVKVDIWNWHDLDLQSTQRHQADDERKRTYEATVTSTGANATRLATATVRTIVANDNGTTALGMDDVRYRQQRSWDTAYVDVYAVSLRDGSRRLLVSKLRDDPSLSPTGAYAVAYDEHRRSWYAVATRDGSRVDLTSRLHVAFYDELDDHPAPPPPYGLAGWVDGDRYVLLRDRYDVWAVDPRNGAARSLTGGLGRRRHIVFEPQQLDPDADSFDGAKPIVLHATNDDTKDQGFWRVNVAGANAYAPQPIVMLPKAVSFATAARAAGRIVAYEQTFSEPRDLWSAATLDAPFARFSDADPQRAA